MAKSVDAIVEPALLVWARKSMRYDVKQAAKKLQVSADKLRQWENGDSRPTIKQLLKMASVYKRPLAVFYLPQPPNEYDIPFDALEIRDWRKLPDTTNREYSTELTLELRKAEYRREVLIDLFSELGQEIESFDLSGQITEPPDMLARRIRASLRITSDEQRKWGNSYAALKAWMHSIEQQNVLVFQTGIYHVQGVSLEEMRGVAISLSELPIILLNVKDAPNGRIFTLMHELCHLLLHYSSVINSHDYRSYDPMGERVEIFCNAFAANILVPVDHLLSEDIVLRHESNADWSDTELQRLASRYCVSEEVILRRLLDLNRTYREFYQRKREEYLERYAEIARKNKEKDRKGSRPYHERFVRTHGTTYVSAVLDAHNNGIINASDVSEYLGTKQKYIPKIQRHLIKETT